VLKAARTDACLLAVLLRLKPNRMDKGYSKREIYAQHPQPPVTTRSNATIALVCQNLLGDIPVLEALANPGSPDNLLWIDNLSD
jgi:hypothetical protein